MSFKQQPEWTLYQIWLRLSHVSNKPNQLTNDQLQSFMAQSLTRLFPKQVQIKHLCQHATWRHPTVTWRATINEESDHHVCTIRGTEIHYKQVSPGDFGRQFVYFPEYYNLTKHFTTFILNDWMVLYGDKINISLPNNHSEIQSFSIINIRILNVCWGNASEHDDATHLTSHTASVTNMFSLETSDTRWCERSASLVPWESTLVCNFRTLEFKSGQSTLPVTALSHDPEEEQGPLHSGGVEIWFSG